MTKISAINKLILISFDALIGFMLLSQTAVATTQAAAIIHPVSHARQINRPMTNIQPSHHNEKMLSMTNLLPASHCQRVQNSGIEYCVDKPIHDINVQSTVKYNAQRTAIMSGNKAGQWSVKYPLASKVSLTNMPIWQLRGGVADQISVRLNQQQLIPIQAKFQELKTGKMITVGMAVIGQEYRIMASMGHLETSTCALFTFARSQFIQKQDCHGDITLQSDKGNIAVQLQSIYVTPYPQTEALKFGAGKYRLVSSILATQAAPKNINVNGMSFLFQPNDNAHINLDNISLEVEKEESLRLIGIDKKSPQVSLTQAKSSNDYSSDMQQLHLEFKTNVLDNDHVKYSLSCTDMLNVDGDNHCALNNTAVTNHQYNKGARDRSRAFVDVYLYPSDKTGMTSMKPDILSPLKPLYEPLQLDKDGYQYSYSYLKIIAPDLATAQQGNWQGLMTITATADF